MTADSSASICFSLSSPNTGWLCSEINITLRRRRWWWGTRGNIRDEEILLKPYLLMKCLISAKSPGDLREISRGGN